jgi:peptidoglycan/LPS O-acetylase OafA/YrhL
MRHLDEAPRQPADGRVSALDGLRGLAVAAVLAFHGGVGWLPGGFLGVDTFFVLSGYLITTLLIREWASTGRIALGAFWARRARRLLPALAVVVVAVCVVGRVVVPPAEAALLRADALAALAYVANWGMIWRDVGYFTQTAAPSLLQHTWSLGIEEQFYLVWPVLLVLLLRARTRRGHRLTVPLVVAVLGIAASTCACVVLTRLHADPSRLYFGSDTRALAVLVGCAVALCAARWPRTSARVRATLAVAAAAGAVAAAWLWSHVGGADGCLYPGGLLLAALATAAVLAHAVVVPESVTARLLSLPGLPALGRISYGVYLWHWPLFAWLDAERTGLSGAALFGTRCAATLVAAVVSFVLVERPLRRGTWFQPQGPAAVLAGAAAVLVLAAASVTVLLPAASPASATSSATGLDDPPAAFTPELPSVVGTAPSSPPAGHRHRTPGAPVSTVVMGDSIAWTLVHYLPPTPGVVVHDNTTLGCGVALGGPYRYFGAVKNVPQGCDTWPGRLRGSVAAFDPDVVVILVGRWETMDRVYDGRWTQLGDAALDDYLRGQLTQAVNIASARGATVVFATEPYNRRGERPDGGLWPEDEPARVDRWNALLHQVGAEHPATVRMMDLGARLCPHGVFAWKVDGVRVRSDGVHLTPDGVRWLTPWLMPQLVAAAA